MLTWLSVCDMGMTIGGMKAPSAVMIGLTLSVLVHETRYPRVALASFDLSGIDLEVLASS